MIKIRANKATNTKAKILKISIELFAEQGYENVTVREIAAKVGIKGSSIYNHFSSKENILEEILEYHKTRLAQQYNNDDIKRQLDALLQNCDLKTILTEMLSIALKGFEDSSLKQVLKILSMEQLNNSIVRNYFYQDYLLKARGVIKWIFDVIRQRGVIQYEDTEFLANEFHAYVIYKYYEYYMLRQDYDIDLNVMISSFTKHIDFFVQALK